MSSFKGLTCNRINKTRSKVVALHTRLSRILNNILMSALAISSGFSQEGQQRSGNSTK